LLLLSLSCVVPPPPSLGPEFCLQFAVGGASTGGIFVRVNGSPRGREGPVGGEWWEWEGVKGPRVREVGGGGRRTALLRTLGF